ncbi:hypothetical protein FF38_10098 [Lucilia cuprina]|uniref:C2H2-type domain-containing protein n=1 Tax=Lucilia cuprina TaxID=7375 RepID=A0A0L0CPD8_LUCCU|nr:hypothetical protein CVS40_1156 [Lucilia cuprina]KNC34210.1 hypothetical protein FF38_10098 [Lucilia cuprina]
MPSTQPSMENAVSFNRECNNPRLEEHMRFICPECGKENNTQQEWRKHLNIQHSYATKTVEDFDFKEIDDKYHECQICMKWVANAHQAIALLQYHRFLHLPYARTYRCKHCPGSFTRKKALCEHLFRFHNGLIAKLDNERKLQELKRTNDEQSPQHNSEFYMKFVCPLCGKTFNRFNIWQQHIDAAHSGTSVDLRLFRIQSTKNYYCAQCCQTLYDAPSKAQLQRHSFTHLPHPLYFQCVYCKIGKSYKSEVLLHVIKSHAEEYEKYKEYIRKPVEWGGQASKDVIKELDLILGTQPAKQTDILQKAIQDSFINLEEEIDKDLKYQHEVALDQSLKELDDILNSEIDPNLQLRTNASVSENEIDEEELEVICNEMFEEIIEQPINPVTESLTKPNRKRLKLDLTAPENGLKLNDSLQKEMQKYINYLCPECGNEFESQSVWRSHVFEQHNLANAVDTKFRAFNAQKTAYICLVCYQIQRTAKHSELRRHHFQHMPYQAYLKCTICTKTKSSKPKMLQHLQFSHLKDIQKTTNAMATSTKTMVKNLRCLDCDKLYAHQTRFETHCRQCPQRLQPLAVGQYDIEKNMKLLEHLQNASRRIGKLLEEEGIDVASMKLPYK